MRLQANGLPGDRSAELRFDSIEDTIEAFRRSTKFQVQTSSFLSESLLRKKHPGQRQFNANLQNFISGNGEFIIVLDSTDRENEGDLIIAAEAITTEKMAFMIRHTRFFLLP